MSFWKKVGNFAKKALPFASMALPFIPGVGGALSGVASAVGRAFGGGSAPTSAGSWNSEAGLDGSYGDAVTTSPGVGGTATLPRYEVSAPSIGGSSSFDWGGLVKSAAPALGAAASGAASVYGQQQANAANAEQAQKQMDFQERMSNTQYQRGMADMQKAGLNPMVAYSQGGASSPQGAQASMANELSGGVSSALQGAQTLQQLEATQAGIGQTKAMTDQVHAEIGRIQANTGVANAQEENLRAQTRDKYPAEVRNLESQARNRDTDTEFLRKTMKPRVSQSHYTSEISGYAREGAYNRAEFEKKYSDYQQNVAPFLSNAFDAADTLRRFIPFGR